MNYDHILWDSQKESVRKCSALLAAGKPALLTDGMGSGKTLSSLCSALSIPKARVLVVCTKSTRDYWRAAAVERLGLVSADLSEAAVDGDAAVLITTHDSLRATAVAKLTCFVTVIDEAHAYAKRGSTRYGEMVATLAAPGASGVVAATATPVYNSFDDVRSLMRLIGRGAEPSLEWVVFTRTVVTLPPCEVRDCVVTMREDEMAAYRRDVEELVERNASPLTLGRVLLYSDKTLDKSLGEGCTLDRFPPSSRELAIVDIVERHIALGTTKKVVVAARHLPFLEHAAAVVRAMIKDVRCFVLNGGSGRGNHKRMIETFNAYERPIVLFVSSGANSEGISLVSSDCLVLADSANHFSVMHERQLIGRLHRFGQALPVHVHRLVSPGTCDAFIPPRYHDLKLDLMRRFAERDPAVLSERSVDDERRHPAREYLDLLNAYSTSAPAPAPERAERDVRVERARHLDISRLSTNKIKKPSSTSTRERLRKKLGIKPNKMKPAYFF